MGGQREQDGAACIVQSFYPTDAYSTATGSNGSLSEKRIATRVAVTIITGMRPQTIGRVLGIGIRIAGRMAGQRLAGQAQAAAAGRPMTVPSLLLSGQAHRPPRAYPPGAGGSVAKGVGGFLRPFARVGGIVWLEVAGVFFFLPVMVFGPKIWKYRMDWLGDPTNEPSGPRWSSWWFSSTSASAPFGAPIASRLPVSELRPAFRTACFTRHRLSVPSTIAAAQPRSSTAPPGWLQYLPTCR